MWNYKKSEFTQELYVSCNKKSIENWLQTLKIEDLDQKSTLLSEYVIYSNKRMHWLLFHQNYIWYMWIYISCTDVHMPKQ